MVVQRYLLTQPVLASLKQWTGQRLRKLVSLILATLLLQAQRLRTELLEVVVAFPTHHGTIGSVHGLVLMIWELRWANEAKCMLPSTKRPQDTNRNAPLASLGAGYKWMGVELRFCTKIQSPFFYLKKLSSVRRRCRCSSTQCSRCSCSMPLPLLLLAVLSTTRSAPSTRCYPATTFPTFCSADKSISCSGEGLG